MQTNARLWLLAYLAALVALTFIHQTWLLAALFVLVLIVCGSARWRYLRRALLTIMAFNLTVSLGYVAISLWRGDFNSHYLLLVNLRVLLMVFLGVWFVARVNVIAALGISPTLVFIVTLAIGQLRACRQIITDFTLAFASRNPAPPRLIDRIREATAQGIALMDKTTAAATDTALAMRSRGVFDD